MIVPRSTINPIISTIKPTLVPMQIPIARRRIPKMENVMDSFAAVLSGIGFILYIPP